MGIPRQALREIGLLNSCQHESMVEMIEVVTSAKIAAGGELLLIGSCELI